MTIYLENRIYIFLYRYYTDRVYRYQYCRGDDKQVAVYGLYSVGISEMFSTVFLFFTWVIIPKPEAHISYNTLPCCFNGVPLVYIIYIY